MSWKAEVIADNSGEWVPNGMRFKTRLGARDYAKDLMRRWTAVRKWRVVKSEDAVTETT